MWVLILKLNDVPDALGLPLCKTSMEIEGYSISLSALPEGSACLLDLYCLPFSSAFLAICLTIYCLFSLLVVNQDWEIPFSYFLLFNRFLINLPNPRKYN